MAVKWSNEVRVYVGAYDVSTAMTRVDVELAAPALDKTGFGDLAESNQADIRRDKVSIGGWFEDSAASVDALIGSLIGSGVGDVMSVGIGTGTGARAYSGLVLTRFVKAGGRVGELVRAEVELAPDTTLLPMKHFGPRVTSTNGTNSGTTDDSTGTSGTGYFISHMFTFSGTLGTVSVNLEHSTDGTTWTNKEAHNYTAVGSTRTTITGSLNRYVRMSSGTTTATGTFSYFSAYKRP